ncbi:head decoration protein [Paenibacillus piscarius]|uniref:head decoration protein n=1 Tax=Paenibacillus piscarius TaxID=1089681 RepID=UPI001EE917B7|nr:head decoration protein [Paenibacillus piscarius]
MENNFARFENGGFRTFFAGTEVSALTTSVTLAPNQGELKKGSVLGIVTTDNQAKLVDATATDGSDVARFVLAEDVDTGTVSVQAVAFKTGIFNADVLIVAAGDTLLSHAEELREVNIHYRTDY